MRELTEREEQAMIERAKAGDPEANYQMSLWALDRAMAEPEEERWNRLAAKCLVRAAEGGYAPAQARMEELLHKNDAPDGPDDGYTPRHGQPEAAAQAAPTAEGAPRPAGRPQGSASLLDRAKGLFAGIAGRVAGLFRGGDKETSGRGETQSGRRKAAFFDFKSWSDARWKRMQLICIVVCVALAILITLLLVTRRHKSSPAEDASALPTPEAIATVEPSPTPEPSAYPDAATLAEIQAAGLDEYPGDDDYVTEETTATVSTSGGMLNLRRGPAQRYGQIAAMSNGTKLSVYAYKDGWALVKYGDSTWGWCSSEFLK